ncbi:hypothetical protein WA158_005511 [Blastocystis sp. Blastoise]
MEKQLLSLVIVIVAFSLNVILVLLSSQTGNIINENECKQNIEQRSSKNDDEKISNLNIKIDLLQEELTKTMKLVTKQTLNSTVEDQHSIHDIQLEDITRLQYQYNNDYKNDDNYYEEDLEKVPAPKPSKLRDITVVIINGNCEGGMKIASSTLYKLNRFYEVVKIHLNSSTDINASTLVSQRLSSISTKYTLIVDSTVQFSLNTNIDRLRSALETNKVYIVGGMEEEGNLVQPMAFDIYKHNNILEYRRGYHAILPGNCIECDRAGHFFLAYTNVLRELWTKDTLPLSLAIDSLYLEAKYFDIKVGSCPVSIFKYDKHMTCNPFIPEWNSIPEEARTRFALKHSIQVYKDIEEETHLFHTYIEREKSSSVYLSPYTYSSWSHMLSTTTTLLNQNRVPYVLSGKELIGGLSIGTPVPWDNKLRVTTLEPAFSSNSTCDDLDISSSMSEYIVTSNSLKAHKSRKYCFTLSPDLILPDVNDITDEKEKEALVNSIRIPGDKRVPFADMEVTHPVKVRDLPGHLLPLKKMKFMNTYVFIPNNPVLYLEQELGETTDTRLEEIHLFKSKLAGDDDEQVWPTCTAEEASETSSKCIQSPYEASQYILDTLLPLLN